MVENRVHAPIDAAILRCAACGAGLGTDAAHCSYCGSAVVRDRLRLSVVCPECYARNPESPRYCTRCGIEFRPQLVCPDPEPRPCPACGDGMSARSIGGLSVRECPRCNGLWVPGDNFDGLIRRAIEARRLPPSTGFGAVRARSPAPAFQAEVVYRRCPVCRETIHRKNFARTSGIMVDWCGKHGTWLDADELEHIADFVHRGGLTAPEGGTRPWSLPANEPVIAATMQLERAGGQAIRNLPHGDTSTISQFLLSLLG